MNLRLMRLAEHEGTAISAALGDDLWKLLQLDVSPPPVLFKSIKGEWSGLCSDEDTTHAGEIEINELLLGTSYKVSTAKAKAKLVTVYLHEWAHRLTEGHGHDAVFAAVNLALLVRANPAYHLLAVNGLSLYDFQDHDRDNAVSLADAATFVVRHGVELGYSEVQVSGLAAEAQARFEQFKAQLVKENARPQREAALNDQVRDLTQQVRTANQGMYLALVGVVLITALAVLSKLH
jgi:hypothetical protein